LNPIVLSSELERATGAVLDEIRISVVREDGWAAG